VDPGAGAASAAADVPVPGIDVSTAALTVSTSSVVPPASPDPAPSAPNPNAASPDNKAQAVGGTGLDRTLPGDGSWSRIASCTPTTAVDFFQRVAATERRIVPMDCVELRDNPVAFAWPQPRSRNAVRPYRLTLQTATGAAVDTLEVNAPRAMVERRLDIGRYRWAVSYTDNDGSTQQSAWRQFEVTANSRYTAMPTADELITRISARSAPRLLPVGKSWVDVASAAQAGEYRNPYMMFLRSADSSSLATLPDNPGVKTTADFATASAFASWRGSLMTAANDELRRIEQLAYAWRLTSDAKYLSAAKSRALNLAAWDPAGTTSEANQPQANRSINVALAIAWDLLYPVLTSAERSAIARALATRSADAVASLGRLDGSPYLSFENTGIHYALQALLLTVGYAELPHNASLMRRVWPLVLSQHQAFGDDQGGYAGSTTYAWYDLHHQSRSMATALLVADVDLTRRAYAGRMGEFLMAAATPNAPLSASFGDGNDVEFLFRNYTFDAYRLYAAIARNAEYEWYWRLRGDVNTLLSAVHPLHFLVHSKRGAPLAGAAPLRRDWFFSGSGHAVMNKGMDALRSSLQFRSSAFGSYNHAHADQNALTFTHKGMPLLISAGYYPYYLSPHHALVTRATRYKNAVTFDGGIGQAELGANVTAPTRPVSSMDTSGGLVNAYSGARVAAATGDATAAYRAWNPTTAQWSPLLSSAVRSVAYVKESGVILVYDWLASTSGKPRRWEFNYHSPQAFGQSGATTLVASNGSAQACIDHHMPSALGSGTLQRGTGFAVAPENGKPNQFHASFISNGVTASMAMVAVIREDCRTDVPIAVAFNSGAATVTVGSQTVSFNRREMVVRE
jgi:hypothetical protein